MNNTVTLSQLITRLAKVADTDTNTSRRFLRTFFGAIEEALIEGESVNIKGIGTFRRSSDSTFGSSTGMSFIPDEQLAKELNAPFEMFQAVELADGVVFPEEKEAKEENDSAQPEIATPATSGTVSESAPLPEPESVKQQQPVAEPLQTELIVPKPEPARPVHAAPQPAVPKTEEPRKAPWETDEFKTKEKPVQPLVHPREEPVKPVAPVFENADDVDDTLPATTKKSTSNLIWIGVGIIIAAGACLGLFAANYLDDDEIAYSEETTESVATPMIEEINVSDIPETGAEPAAVEPAAVVADAQPVAQETPVNTAEQPAAAETQPKKEPRYDTVTKTNYLAQMARRYYGHATYWVFIYEANTDVLHNPNRISPGTRVRIPDESELPGTTSAERQKIASQKCGELERKYK